MWQDTFYNSDGCKTKVLATVLSFQSFDACQDVPLKDLSEFMPEKWNPWNEVPMTRWLLPAIPDEQYRARMKTCGNVVVPQCGDLAMAILHRMKLESV